MTSCERILSFNTYIPLHVHTAKGSIGDSTLKIKEYVQKAKQLGMKYLASTNHGSLADIFEFYHTCVEEDIKPIIGCEVYETDDRLAKDSEHNNYWHLVLIAKNEVGFRNLLHITTDAQLNGYYYKPRTDIQFMREHGEGLIALTACLGGKIPQAILNGDDYDDVVRKLDEYKSIFDSVYLEIQPGDFEDQQNVNQAMLVLSEETDTPLILTNDVHYLNAEDWQAHDIHVRISRKMNLEGDPIYPDRCYYFMGYDEMIALPSISSLPRSATISAINNTLCVASSVRLSLASGPLHMPVFEVPEGHTEESYLSMLCYERLEHIRDNLIDPSVYVSRIEYELETINELGFAGYFLTVRDYVMHANSEGIPVGPGRGSVCGSLVAYLTGITKVDPIRYNLLFERFLSVHRKGSVPDIDMDFSSDRRQEMFDYVVSKYGRGRCALVSTFGMRKARAALKDTARVFEIDKELADYTAKLIPQVYYDDEGEKSSDLSIGDSLEIVPELRRIRNENPDWFEFAQKLEDLPSHTSIHAAGTIISPVDLMDYIPLIKPNSEFINATALTLKSAEDANFIKFDFLGLATLNVTDKTERDAGFTFDFDNNDFDDEAVWNLISSKNTTGLFQIGSRIYKDRMGRLNPRTIEQLAACLALVRGPCISAKDDVKYMEIVEGKRDIELIHPFYDEVTKRTNGILLYQEQLMKICVNFGFSLEEGYKIMKASAKKKFDVLRSYEEQFMLKAEERSVPQDVADRIFKMIVDSGLYSFNESHAIAYALLCYQSAYLKVHYPLEYMRNTLTNAYIRKEEIEDTIKECRRMGIKFLPLSINYSDWDFTIEDGMIRIGMVSIKSFGEGAAAEVLTKRPFDNMEDFMERVEKGKCSKRAIVPAIFAGLFADFDDSRRTVYEHFCAIRREEPLEEIKLQGGGSFRVDDPYDSMETILIGAPLISDAVNDFESIGFGELKKNKEFSIQAVVRKVKKLKDRNNKMMAFLTLETADGYLECTMFADTYSKFKSFCKKDLICWFRAKKDGEDSCVALEAA